MGIWDPLTSHPHRTCIPHSGSSSLRNLCQAGDPSPHCPVLPGGKGEGWDARGSFPSAVKQRQCSDLAQSRGHPSRSRWLAWRGSGRGGRSTTEAGPATRCARPSWRRPPRVVGPPPHRQSLPSEQAHTAEAAVAQVGQRAHGAVAGLELAGDVVDGAGLVCELGCGERRGVSRPRTGARTQDQIRPARYA